MYKFERKLKIALKLLISNSDSTRYGLYNNSIYAKHKLLFKYNEYGSFFNDINSLSVDYYSVGLLSKVCDHCKCLLFEHEDSSLCCHNIYHVKDIKKLTKNIKNLFFSKKNNKTFSKDIQYYSILLNRQFSFSSHVIKHGKYQEYKYNNGYMPVYKITGQIYHGLPKLYSKSRYFYQVYFLDADEQINLRSNRLSKKIKKKMNWKVIVGNIQKDILKYNPLNKAFCSIYPVLEKEKKKYVNIGLKICDPSSVMNSNNYQKSNRPFKASNVNAFITNEHENVNACRSVVVYEKN